MTTIVGFDPGLTGAFAIFHNGALVAVEDLPVIDRRVNAPLLAEALDLYQPELAVIEALHAMPINGSKANFSQGHSLGVIQGVTAALPQVLLTPTTWKKTVGINSGDRDSQKEKSRALCVRNWPEMASSFARKKDADRADATLIAYAHLLSTDS